MIVFFAFCILYFMKDYILVLDSGIGGLSVFDECIRVFRGRYIYLSISKALPLGNKSKKQIFEIVRTEIDKLLLKFRIKIVVIACNTITTSIIGLLRDKYHEISFIGTEPCLKLVKDKGYKRALVVSTVATKRHSEVIKRYRQKSDFVIGDRHLAKLIEINKNRLHLLYPYILKRYSKYKGKIDCVVLGCTHYSFIKNIFEDVLGVKSFDSAFYVAKRLVTIAQRLKIKEGLEINFCDNGEKDDIFRYFCQNSLIYDAKYAKI